MSKFEVMLRYHLYPSEITNLQFYITKGQNQDGLERTWMFQMSIMGE